MRSVLGFLFLLGSGFLLAFGIELVIPPSVSYFGPTAGANRYIFLGAILLIFGLSVLPSISRLSTLSLFGLLFGSGGYFLWRNSAIGWRTLDIDIQIYRYQIVFIVGIFLAWFLLNRFFYYFESPNRQVLSNSPDQSPGSVRIKQKDSASNPIEEELRSAKKMLDEGLIDQQEYVVLKKKIIDRN